MYTKVLSFIISRLVIVLTLFCLAVLMSVSWTPKLDPKPLVTFSVVVSILSFIYYGMLYISKSYTLQIYIQVFVDILLNTWLIYLMRNSDISLVPLYLVIVLSSSMVLPRYGVITTGLCCMGSYAVLLLLSYTAIIDQNNKFLEINNPNTIYIIALPILTILAGQLAEKIRHSSYALKTATKHLADLQVFNERIIQSINSGLVTTDLQGHILSFNKAAEEITKYSENFALKKSFNDIFGDSKFVSFSDNNQTNTEFLPKFEIDCKTKEGKIIHLGFQVSILTNNSAIGTGYVFSFQDLTDVIKLENEIRRQDRLAALGKMAAGIAHEVRNPLTAMRGSIQLLHNEIELTEDQDHLMKIVLRESDRLDRIINDFLAYARPSPLKLISVNITTLVAETITLLRNSTEIKQNHKIHLYSYPESINFVVDPSQIRQVIWNLSRNAIQAMPDGGDLNISLQITSSKNLQIKVSDTGIGLSEQEIENIFEPFNSSKVGGTGLGLAIVYQIITDHHGTIDITSKQKSNTNGVTGTEITIELPFSS